MKLFYIILGATPKGRNIEQHDVFFGIAESLKDLVPDIKDFWKEADGKIHLDCYQEVKFADGFEVKIVEKEKKFQKINCISSIWVAIKKDILKSFMSNI